MDNTQNSRLDRALYWNLGMETKLVALALAIAGAWLMHSGVAAREAVEPEAFVAGAGFIPVAGEAPGAGQERSAAVSSGEVRSSVVALVAPSVAAAGGTRRTAGLGLLAAGLALAWATAFGGNRDADGRSPFPWLPTLILLPGAYALFRLGVEASLRAPAVDDARAAFALWAPAAVLSLVLILARSGTGRARPR